MKIQIVQQNGKFIPQLKTNWWSSWFSLAKGKYGRVYPTHCSPVFGASTFDTPEEAAKLIKQYMEGTPTRNKVVWEMKL